MTLIQLACLVFNPVRKLSFSLIKKHFFKLINFVPMLCVWEWPTAEAWLYLWGMALSGTAAHVLFTRAVGLVEITSLQPLEFAKLPFAVILAWLVFSEWPDIWIWIGGSVIFASTAYITRREAMARQPAIPEAKAGVGTPL